jgi:hypothetical protein
MTTSAPEALRFLVSHAAAAVVLTAMVVVAAALLRWWWTRQGLAQRVRLVALPTESFEPEAEEVLRLATQLARTRRAVHRLGGRRTDAVRLRLVAVQGGKVLQFIEGPKRAEAVLRLGGYAEVELLPPETVEKATFVTVAPPADSATGDAPVSADDDDDVEAEEMAVGS